MDLIKKLNDDANEAALSETMEDNNVFKILDITKIRGINDILEAGEGKCGSKPKTENEESGLSKHQMTDMKKLVSQYIANDEVTPENVLDLAADDLEMLEYNPEEVESMAPEIETMFKKGKK
jgi:hypothetical protein